MVLLRQSTYVKHETEVAQVLCFTQSHSTDTGQPFYVLDMTRPDIENQIPEKLEIIKRFDDAKTLKESKGVYKSLIKEISKKEPIKESIDVKLNESKSSGSATEITESKVYVDPQIEKMKKLWSYEYKN